MREVVANHPVVPGQLRPIRELREPGVKARLNSGSVRCGIEDDPTGSREIGFDPAVGVAGADDVVSAKFVEFSRQEAVDFTCRNAQSSQHHGHR